MTWRLQETHFPEPAPALVAQPPHGLPLGMSRRITQQMRHAIPARLDLIILWLLTSASPCQQMPRFLASLREPKRPSIRRALKGLTRNCRTVLARLSGLQNHRRSVALRRLSTPLAALPMYGVRL